MKASFTKFCEDGATCKLRHIFTPVDPELSLADVDAGKLKAATATLDDDSLTLTCGCEMRRTE